jgi:hypothetical protein
MVISKEELHKQEPVVLAELHTQRYGDIHRQAVCCKFVPLLLVMLLQLTQNPLIITLVSVGQVHVFKVIFKLYESGHEQSPSEEFHTKLVRQTHTLLATRPVPKANVLQFTHDPFKE